MPADTVLARLAAALREKRLRDQLTQSEALVIATAIERCGFELQQWLGRELPEGEAGDAFDWTPETVDGLLREIEELVHDRWRSAALFGGGRLESPMSVLWRAASELLDLRAELAECRRIMRDVGEWHGRLSALIPRTAARWDDALWLLVAEHGEMRAALERLGARAAAVYEGEDAHTQRAGEEFLTAFCDAVKLGDRLRGASVRRVEDADPEAP